MTPFDLCLTRWNVTKSDYDTMPHASLFMVVEECLCKSERAEMPDSKIIIFKRGEKWGFAISVYNTMNQGMMWLPSIQCKVFNSRGEATLAGIAKFKQLATNERLLKWVETLSEPQAMQMSIF